jgi:hypothetical protein
MMRGLGGLRSWTTAQLLALVLGVPWIGNGVAVFVADHAARVFGLLVGMLYLVAPAWGLLVGDEVLGVIRVDDLGSADHAVEAALLLVGWVVSAPTTSQGRSAGAEMAA